MTKPGAEVHCKDEQHLHVIVARGILETVRPVTVAYQKVMPCKNVLGLPVAGVVLSIAPGKPFDGLHVLGTALPWLIDTVHAAITACIDDAETISITHPEHGDFHTFLTLGAVRMNAVANQLAAAWAQEPV